MNPIYFVLFFLYASIINASIVHASMYDHNQANINVWLSGASYCSKDAYSTMKLGGPAKGFQVSNTIYDKKTDVNGYIGVLHTQKTVYVVIRGTNSVKNWVDDLEVFKTKYITYPECECEVHKGFYKSVQAVSNFTVSAVLKLLHAYPGYDVIFTGHSYGAAIGQLLGMELRVYNIASHVYNYGQPRSGDTRFANFFNALMPYYWRHTHDADIVPHVPPENMGYTHSCGEVFENREGALTFCSETVCEDPKCTDQYSLIHTSASDHEVYLGHPLDCDKSIL